jgi:hypothetical protein
MAAKDHEPINVIVLVCEPVTAKRVSRPLLNPSALWLAFLRYADNSRPVLAVVVA